MGLLERVAREVDRPGGRKAWSEPPFWALDQYRNGLLSYSTPDRERIENDFEGYIDGAYKSDGIVFACVLTRQLIFSEARFQWREFRNGRPGNLFGTPELALLENPWPNGTTGELLTRMEVDLSLAGNFYATTADDRGRLGGAATGPGRRISVLRPDWVSIVIGSASGNPYAADAKPVGYLYEPRPLGQGHTGAATLLLPGEVCHYSLVPDPAARFRGMSWLTPVLREIASDRAATSHKLKFFEHGASLNTVVSFDKSVGTEAFKEFVREFKAEHEGADNANKTLFLGAGADVTVVGTDLKQLDFKAVQGSMETRIAAASGVGAVIAQFSEGMQGSSLNAGNYSAAKRRAGDALFRPLWRTASAALQSLVTPPTATASLWYDDRDISFLQEDAKDAADIVAIQLQAIRSGCDAGFDPDSVVDAVSTLDITRLKGQHSGLFSVQLQPPLDVMSTEEPPSEPSTNGDRPALPAAN